MENPNASIPSPSIPVSPQPPPGPPISTSTTINAPAPPLSEQAKRNADFKRTVHNICLFVVIGAPVLIAMPPRKFDTYTMMLLGSGLVSGNHLITERYNMGIIEIVGRRLSGAERKVGNAAREGTAAIQRAEERMEQRIENFALPTEKARRVHEGILGAEEAVRLRREGEGYLLEKARVLREQGWGYGADMKRRLQVAVQSVDKDKHGITRSENEMEETTLQRMGVPVEQATMSDGRRDTTGMLGIGRKAWDKVAPSRQESQAGQEKWWEQRRREEKEALEDGRGYQGLIIDQIYEVFNWDKTKNEDGEWVLKPEYEEKYKRLKKEN